MTNRKLHMRFRLAPRSMTLDDLELLVCIKMSKPALCPKLTNRLSLLNDTTSAYQKTVKWKAEVIAMKYKIKAYIHAAIRISCSRNAAQTQSGISSSVSE